MKAMQMDLFNKGNTIKISIFTIWQATFEIKMQYRFYSGIAIVIVKITTRATFSVAQHVTIKRNILILQWDNKCQ